MTVMIGGERFYRTKEVCEKVGLSRSTLLRWLREGVVGDAEARDRRGWRLFTETDVKRMQAEANQVNRANETVAGRGD